MLKIAATHLADQAAEAQSTRSEESRPPLATVLGSGAVPTMSPLPLQRVPGPCGSSQDPQGGQSLGESLHSLPRLGPESPPR